ncbi:MAG TPA: hypothetical protein VIY98_05055 [Nitrososphaeraceae archaeon]
MSENKLQVDGEKKDNKKSNDLNFKVYTDYLIQDPSEYGEKDN